MEYFNELTGTIALALGTAWASGINLYAAILVLGLLGATGNMVLPENLEILTNPMIIGVAAIMYLVEFFADKIPDGMRCIRLSAYLPGQCLPPAQPEMSIRQLPSPPVSWEVA